MYDPAEAVAPETAESRAARIERLRLDLIELAGPTRGPVLYEYAQRTTPDTLIPIAERLENMLSAIVAGRIEGLLELAMQPPAIASLKLRLVAELQHVARHAAGLPWDDPSTIRQVRRIAGCYLGTRFPAAPALVLADLMLAHVRIEGDRLALNVNAIVDALAARGYAERVQDVA